MTMEQVMEIVLKDMDFYSDSGGGVTFSGGEPILYAGFIAGLSGMLKKKGIHVTVQTAGNIDYKNFRLLAGKVDLFLYDIKIADRLEHKKWTGACNDKILANLASLAESSARILVRMPLVPGINDAAARLVELSAILHKNNIKQIMILPYHKLGESKIKRIDAPVKPLGIPAATPEDIKRAREFFTKEGIDVYHPDETFIQ